MAQETLEEQYANLLKWSPRYGSMDVLAESLRIRTEASSKARSLVNHESGVSYGSSDKETLDIYGLNSLPKDAPILVFIHGGYWQFASVTRQNSSCMAVPVVTSGTILVVIDYDSAPHVDLDTIVHEVKKAMKYVLQFADKRGSRGIYVSGNSAGGHLSGMMLTVDWTKEVGGAAKLLKGWIGMSGVYSPTPIIETSLNTALKLTKESASRNDCMNYVTDICQFNADVECLIVVGQHEPPEMHRQSEEFCEKLKKGGMKTTYQVVPDRDHCSLIENLMHADDMLLKAILKMIK